MLVINKAGLLEAMIDSGVGVRELSRRAGLTPRVISEMLNKDLRFVRLKTLSKLRDALGCSLYSLILKDVKRDEIKRS